MFFLELPSRCSWLTYTATLPFLLLLSAAAISAQTVADIGVVTLDGTTQSFLSPATIFRQDSESCSCICLQSDPKTSPPCAGMAATCTVVRCVPRTDGFACCEDSIFTGGLRSAEDITGDLEFIDNNAPIAAAENPELLQASVDILGRCIDDILEIGEQVTEDIDDGSSRIVEIPTLERQVKTKAKSKAKKKAKKNAKKSAKKKAKSKMLSPEEREARRIFRELIATGNTRVLERLRNALDQQLPPPRDFIRPNALAGSG